MLPEIPTITGPVEGKIGELQEYQISASDPNDDDMLYIVDWGDMNKETVGPFSSGLMITV